MKSIPGLQVLTKRFLVYERVRHFSPHTVEAHVEMLYRSQLFCAGLGLTRAQQVTRAVVLKYQVHLYHHRKKDGQAMTVSTQKHLLGVVKKLYSYLNRAAHAAQQAQCQGPFPDPQGQHWQERLLSPLPARLRNSVA